MSKSLSFLAIAIAMTGSVVAMLAWQRVASHDNQRPRAVYICRETGELFVGRGDASPQIHPDTGRATLCPALYCFHCETWTVAPPADRLSRQPKLLECPKCGQARSFEGEIPETASEF